MHLEKVKNFLRPFFKWRGKAPLHVTLIRPFAVAAALLGVGDKLVLPNLPGRSLTAGEVAMLQPIFKDAVDYSKVRIHHSRATDVVRFVFRATAITRGSTIVESDDTPDYSKASFGQKYQFTHEMTHVWQNQNGVSDSFFRVANRGVARVNLADDQLGLYSYSLKGGPDLTAFNVEQQAGIVPDYFLIVKNPVAVKVNLQSPLDLDPNDGTTKRLAAYEAVLKNFLANPKYPRYK